MCVCGHCDFFWSEKGPLVAWLTAAAVGWCVLIVKVENCGTHDQGKSCTPDTITKELFGKGVLPVGNLLLLVMSSNRPARVSWLPFFVVMVLLFLLFHDLSIVLFECIGWWHESKESRMDKGYPRHGWKCPQHGQEVNQVVNKGMGSDKFFFLFFLLFVLVLQVDNGGKVDEG